MAGLGLALLKAAPLWERRPGLGQALVPVLGHGGRSQAHCFLGSSDLSGPSPLPNDVDRNPTFYLLFLLKQKCRTERRARITTEALRR